MTSSAAPKMALSPRCGAGPRYSLTKEAMKVGVYSIASHPAVASGSFCTVTPQKETPCFSYAASHLEVNGEDIGDFAPAMRQAAGP